MNQSQTKIRW